MVHTDLQTFTLKSSINGTTTEAQWKLTVKNTFLSVVPVEEEDPSLSQPCSKSAPANCYSGFEEFKREQERRRALIEEEQKLEKKLQGDEDEDEGDDHPDEEEEDEDEDEEEEDDAEAQQQGDLSEFQMEEEESEQRTASRSGGQSQSRRGRGGYPKVSTHRHAAANGNRRDSGGSYPFNNKNKDSAANGTTTSTTTALNFDLNVESILAGSDTRTTLMIKNIPNKYSQKMLLAALDAYRGQFDFFYLPIDFKNKCNVGYAFINFVQPKYIVPFFEKFNGHTWEKFNSLKVCNITYARIQGKQGMIDHFRNSRLLIEDKVCRPLIFYSDGVNAGDEEEFPIGPNYPHAKGTPIYW